MLGLNFPKLFYGRLSRNRVAGCRADFCEFCVCVCRHDVVSFEAAAAIFFVPMKYEEFKRESRCEICRTQFPLSTETEFKKDPFSGRKMDTPIVVLIEETNPEILRSSVKETGDMIGRTSGDTCFIRQRMVGFLQSHEDEYRFWFRKFGPIAAIGSIQATLVGFALSFVAPLWISLGMMLAVYLLVVVAYWAFLRKKLYQEFAGRMDKIRSLIDNETTDNGFRANDMDVEQTILELLHRLRNRFPKATSVFEAQFRSDFSPLKSRNAIVKDVDYVGTVELWRKSAGLF